MESGIPFLRGYTKMLIKIPATLFGSVTINPFVFTEHDCFAAMYVQQNTTEKTSYRDMSIVTWNHELFI